MPDADKTATVFISYRRSVSAFIARAVFMDLRQHGYNVFMDVESIDAGEFDRIILSQIAARAHFLVILTPGSIERCIEPGDWLRREIEAAIRLQRNVVPLLANGFTFDGTESILTGDLERLTHFNALNLPHEYFEAAMERLRTRFLKQPFQGVLHAAYDAPTVEHKITRTATLPKPTQEQLSAEAAYNQANAKYHRGDMNGAAADYDTAIRLYPQYDAAYSGRALARCAKGEVEGALADANEATGLNGNESRPYGIRAFIRGSSGDVDGALADADEAVRLSPGDAEVYGIRAVARELKGDLDGAWADVNEAIRLNARLAEFYAIRGDVRHARGDLDGAIADYDEAIHLNPRVVEPYYDRGFARAARGDLPGALADLQTYLDLGGGHLNGDHAKIEQWIKDIKRGLQE